MRKAILLPAVLAASCCVLTACSGSSKKDAATSAASTTSASSAAATTDSTSAAPTTTTSAAAPASAKSKVTSAAAPGKVPNLAYTAQGAKLKIGQKAIVPFKYGKNVGAIGITVTGISPGTAAQLKPLKLGSRGAGLIPWYVHATITNEGGTNLAYSAVDSLHGSLADGSEAQDVIVFGTFAKCDSASATASFVKKGASFTTCELAVAPKGLKVTGAQYNDFDAKALHPKSNYEDGPLQWK